MNLPNIPPEKICSFWLRCRVHIVLLVPIVQQKYAITNTFNDWISLYVFSLLITTKAKEMISFVRKKTNIICLCTSMIYFIIIILSDIVRVGGGGGGNNHSKKLSQQET